MTDAVCKCGHWRDEHGDVDDRGNTCDGCEANPNHVTCHAFALDAKETALRNAEA